MMKKLLAVVLAAFLAAPVAFAADRPVGPETGQVRTDRDDGVNPPDPDDINPPDTFDGPGRGEWSGFMPAPDSCWFWWRCDG